MCKRQVSQAFYEQFLSPSCPPIGAVQSLLELVHRYTGMPWWLSLAVTTAALRTVLTLPLMAYSMDNAAKLERLQPEIGNISKELMAEVVAAQQQYRWESNIAKYHFRKNVSYRVCTIISNKSCTLNILSLCSSQIMFVVTEYVITVHVVD